MALNNGGPSPWGNPRPGGPWGTPPPTPPGGGGPGGPGPDLDDLIRQAQDAVRRIPVRGRRRRRQGPGHPGLIVLALWLASGFYRVQPDEQGVVLRFGAFDRTAAPGLNYHMPWPVESVETPRGHHARTWSSSASARASADLGPRPGRARRAGGSLMLTGDENIIDIDFVVRWRIRDAGDFLFNTRNPETRSSRPPEHDA